MTPTSLDFFSRLKWLDGRPLMDTIEPYRRRLFTLALDTRRDDGAPLYNLVLAGRGKKNWKSADLVLTGLYSLLIKESPQGSDGFILGNDEDQANQDLSLAKKLVAVNAEEIGGEVEVLSTEIKRTDGRGSLKILPARNVSGQHGKTALFIGYDEIHGYRTWDLFEALAPDPTRTDVLQWVTSYDSIFNTPGNPLYDLKQRGIVGDDPGMLFSWYSGDICTDPDFAGLPPEQRANPSMASWPDGVRYLEQQKRRLPAHKYRRLHLNMPGAPSGAFLDPDSVLAAIVTGRKRLGYDQRHTYYAFIDMSGGSSDDATLGIAHQEGGKSVVDVVESQAGAPPFNPRQAVIKFANELRAYKIRSVTGDNYAGNTFKVDFEELGIGYTSCRLPKTELYEQMEPRLNAGEIELPDLPKLQEQALGLVVRGTRVDHLPGEHDDWINAAAGAAWCAATRSQINTGLIGRYSWG
ncbi:hypothetical protein [Bradyrhizobium sp. BWC-3-1]|uniref:hypothetical protein n=1 Tax=Bradyrhizobium sp. BWC-3-1 TaxID=3080012 RepID=UPI00293E4F4A|nr:hypothetical protein [Bradyrhizobium sp. BWC-3-1]WOH55046.1 hypothetical protein RX329_22230 [Bradyrhizobium sp. BWC-3-1]